MIKDNYFIYNSDQRKAFLVKKIQNDHLYFSLIKYFYYNPGTYDSLKGISLRLGLNQEIIKDKIDDLLKVGILQSNRSSEGEVYLLKKQKSVLNDFRKALSVIEGKNQLD